MRKSQYKKHEKIKEENDDYDLDDPFIDDNEFSKKRNKKDFIIEEIKKEIVNRNIGIEHIIKLNLSIDENIWFYENFKILSGYEQYTEEWYELRNKIYKKYTNIKNYGISVNDDLIVKINNSNHNINVKQILYNKYSKLNNNTNTEENSKIIDWINTVLEVPLEDKIKENLSIDKTLTNIWNELNNNIYGLQNAKEKLMENLCSKLINNNNDGKIITLVGPYGVGKTSFAKSISNALGIPFDIISLNSITDPSIITGFASTYIGSSPSIFTKTIIKSQTKHMIVLLDEIDKIESKSVSSTLINILDYSQNNKFKDHYMPEIPIDLSKILFLISANNINNIDKALLDRMNIINIEGYTKDEKIIIVQNFIIPKILSRLSLSNKNIIFDTELLEYLIYNFDDTEGLRKIEKIMDQIYDRIILLKNCTNIDFTFKLNKSIVFPYKISIDDLQILIK